MLHTVRREPRSHHRTFAGLSDVQELGPDAQGLLEVVAFFPQGINENRLDSNGFVTTLAPLRDYLWPKAPTSSLLLCETMDRYFSRLLIGVDPDKPDFKEALWIRWEDVNVER